jgi:hypothetical protein
MFARISPLRSRRRLAFAAGAMILLLAACSSAASAPIFGSATGGGSDNTTTDLLNRQAAPVAAPIAAPAGAPADAGGVSSPDNSVALSSDLLIVKTGNLDLQVKSLDDALSVAEAKIIALGGYVSASTRSGEADAATASITYRIPAARWDEALADLRAIGIKVLDEQTQAAEVTGQVLDLGARLTNLAVTEAALQAIMVKAVKIADVLAVQAQLTDVRGQIEELTTEQQHLSDQAAFGTLTLGLSLASAPAVTTASAGFDPGQQADQALARLVELGQALATAGIWLAIVGLPLVVGLGILILLIVLLTRLIRRRRRVRPAPVAIPES